MRVRMTVGATQVRARLRAASEIAFAIWIAISAFTIVGCDGLIGSTKKFDQCGVCGGDNTTCRIVSGFFTRPTLPVGYNLIAQIPKGACHINITELKPSKNYLALRTSDGRYIINGNWAINWSGSYEAAGTVFSYRRHDLLTLSGEQILAEGPTTENVDVLMIFQQPNPGIEYKYVLSMGNISVPWRPHSAPHVPVGDARWTHGSSTTSSTVAYGSHQTNLIPVDASGLDNRRRDPSRKWKPHGNKPHRGGADGTGRKPHPSYSLSGEEQTLATSSVITDGHSQEGQRGRAVRRRRREYRWRIMGFSECSQTCGGGTQETLVSCVKRNSLTPVEEFHCDPSSRPKVQVVRCGTTPCPARWVEGPWSPCSTSCGEGIQTRNITCMQVLSSDLTVPVPESSCLSGDQPVPPPVVQSCLGTACSTTLLQNGANWKIGDWGKCSVQCGVGTVRRVVQCVSLDGKVLPDLECGTNKPSEEDVCNMGPCVATWLFSDWSETCSSECGVGKQTRKVVCPGGAECDPAKKPEAYRSCNVSHACGALWFAGPWNKCSSPCGPGIQTREVMCLHKTQSGNWTQVSDEACREQDKPRQQQNCNPKPCTEEWYTSDWTECSKSCDTGVQTREVACLDTSLQSSSECPASDKPLSRQACNTKECPHAPQDPSCVDTFPNCPLVVRARLCSYAYYKNLCCDSCSKTQH